MSDHDRSRRQSNSTAGRVPPHSVEAEEALLGAVLLDRRAVAILVEHTSPADFYKPAHQHIASAVVALASAEVHVDTITVVDHLRRHGLLELSGGAEALHGLQNLAPSISGAEHYARIVAETAHLRRLVFASAEITELAYSTAGDASGAVAHAQEILERLATRSAEKLSTLEVADIAALLASDLTPEEPSLLTRSDGAALFYAGKMHTLQAEPSSGKSWLACAAVVETLALGGSSIYLDFEDTAIGIVKRLLVLGAHPAAVRDRFVHVNPVGPMGPTERLDLGRVIDRLNPDLIVIDGVAEALSRSGFSEDKADDIVRWTEQLPRPLSRTGAAVVMLDHVGKDPEARGRWARGSGHKLAMVDGVTYQVKVITPFARHRSGLIKLVVAKDRPGGVGPIGYTAAAVKIEPHANGERVVLTIDPDTAPLAHTDTWRPTGLMTKVSQILEGSAVPLTATAVRSMVHSDKRGLVTEAIARLTAEGYIAQRGRTLSLVAPFRDGSTPPALDPPVATALFDADEYGAPELPDEPEHLAAEQRDYLDYLSTHPDL